MWNNPILQLLVNIDGIPSSVLVSSPVKHVSNEGVNFCLPLCRAICNSPASTGSSNRRIKSVRLADFRKNLYVDEERMHNFLKQGRIGTQMYFEIMREAIGISSFLRKPRPNFLWLEDTWITQLRWAIDQRVVRSDRIVVVLQNKEQGKENRRGVRDSQSRPLEVQLLGAPTRQPTQLIWPPQPTRLSSGSKTYSRETTADELRHAAIGERLWDRADQAPPVLSFDGQVSEVLTASSPVEQSLPVGLPVPCFQHLPFYNVEPDDEGNSDYFALRFRVPVELLQQNKPKGLTSQQGCRVSPFAVHWLGVECSKPHPLDISGLTVPDEAPSINGSSFTEVNSPIPEAFPQPWSSDAGRGDQESENEEDWGLIPSLFFSDYAPSTPEMEDQSCCFTPPEVSQSREGSDSGWSWSVRRSWETSYNCVSVIRNMGYSQSTGAGLRTIVTSQWSSTTIRSSSAMGRDEPAAHEPYVETPMSSLSHTCQSSIYEEWTSTISWEDQRTGVGTCPCLTCRCELWGEPSVRYAANNTNVTSHYLAHHRNKPLTRLDEPWNADDNTCPCTRCTEERSAQSNPLNQPLAAHSIPSPTSSHASESDKMFTRQQVVGYLMNQVIPSHSNPDGIEAYAITHPAQNDDWESEMTLNPSVAKEVIHRVLMSGFPRAHCTRGAVADLVDNCLSVIFEE